jgi:hypothetical protein
LVFGGFAVFADLLFTAVAVCFGFTTFADFSLLGISTSLLKSTIVCGQIKSIRTGWMVWRKRIAELCIDPAWRGILNRAKFRVRRVRGVFGGTANVVSPKFVEEVIG